MLRPTITYTPKVHMRISKAIKPNRILHVTRTNNVWNFEGLEITRIKLNKHNIAKKLFNKIAIYEVREVKIHSKTKRRVHYLKLSLKPKLLDNSCILQNKYSGRFIQKIQFTSHIETTQTR